MRISRAKLVRFSKLLLEAEREYTQAAYSRVLAELEEFPADHPQLRFHRTAVMHSLAEMRGDLPLMRKAIAEYEAMFAAGILNPELAKLMPALIEDRYAQVSEAEAERRGA